MDIERTDGNSATTTRASRLWVGALAAARALRTLTVVIVMVLVVVVLGAVSLTRAQGGAAYKVLSPSMEPTYPVGSLALLVPTDSSNIRPGDVVLVPRSQHTPIMHRVVEVSAENGVVRVLTKGDANQSVDPEATELGSTVLVARRHIPYAGYILGWLVTPVGWFLLFVAPATLLAAQALVRIWSSDSGPTEVRRPRRGSTAALLVVAIVAAAAASSAAGSAHALLGGSTPVDANTFSTATEFP
jgi:signal peptidase